MLKSISRILPFLIVTLLCIGGVELFYGMAERYLVIPEKKVQTSELAAAVQGQSLQKLERHNNYDVIVDRNLFQSYLKEPEPVEEVVENPLEGLETTTLDLVLMGTISGREDRSRAIILEKAKRKQEIYYTGDVVQGAEIKEILRGKVILSYQGRDEILDMSEAAKVKPSSAPTPTAVSPVTPRTRAVAAPRQRPRRIIPKAKGPGMPSIEDEVAEQFDDQIEEPEEDDQIEEPEEDEEVEKAGEDEEHPESTEAANPRDVLQQPGTMSEYSEDEEGRAEDGQESMPNS